MASCLYDRRQIAEEAIRSVRCFSALGQPSGEKDAHFLWSHTCNFRKAMRPLKHRKQEQPKQTNVPLVTKRKSVHYGAVGHFEREIARWIYLLQT